MDTPKPKNPPKKKEYEQKVVITESETRINDFIDEGWKVISFCGTGVASGYNVATHGKFSYLLERSK